MPEPEIELKIEQLTQAFKELTDIVEKLQQELEELRSHNEPTVLE